MGWFLFNFAFLWVWIILWLVLWFFVFKFLESKKQEKLNENWASIVNKAEKQRNDILKEAQQKQESIVSQAQKESNDMIRQAKKDSSELMNKAEKLQERLLEKEEKLEKKLEDISNKQDDIFKREEEYENNIKKVKEKERDLDGKIEEISKLTEQEAKDLFIKSISKKYEKDWLAVIEKRKKDIQEKSQDMAREIILKSIQQYAWDVTNEVTTTMISIPSDDIKWKLIWKEWRNIVAFERATWVALIIDDTPDSVFISAFDLFRRYIAKKSLEKLIEDGRIQPARIEEVVEKINEEAQILLKDLWTQTLLDLNINWIPEQIIPLIWKLRFRTSYGQNILKHSIEVSIIAESIAKDLWVDPVLIKKWWLLHDIWKALDHDIEWTHPEIWAKVWRKYWLDEKIVDMIENHHWEQFSISIYAAIVQVADAISSVRPWARREAIEQYIKRVQEMEALVQSFSGVNKAYAISAWREVRVFVDANTISDLEAHDMAKKIADNIQLNLNYPWEIKVNLVREMRIIEYAK